MKRYQWRNVFVFSLPAFGFGVLLGNMVLVGPTAAISIFLGSIVLAALAVAAWQ